MREDRRLAKARKEIREKPKLNALLHLYIFVKEVRFATCIGSIQQ